MQEKQVTIGDETFPVPKPFFVFATMNPVEQEGTYSLPEAQLDRFLMKLIVTYPTKKQEADVVKMVIKETKLPAVQQLMNAEDILSLQKVTREIFIEDKIISYITDLIQATRDPKAYGLSLDNVIQYGASPRASISLALVGRARADPQLPDDVCKLFGGFLIRNPPVEF